MSLEAARSHMGVVDDLARARYRGGVGPGAYNVHSPDVPGVPDIGAALRRASVPSDQDGCGSTPTAGSGHAVRRGRRRSRPHGHGRPAPARRTQRDQRRTGGHDCSGT
ncbi:MAG: hypothetical protein ACRDY1_09590 [Acidimicrobiales bacterium]